MNEPKSTIICFTSFEQFIREYQLNQEELTLIIPAINPNEVIIGLTSKFKQLFIDKIKIGETEFLVVNCSR